MCWPGQHMSILITFSSQCMEYSIVKSNQIWQQMFLINSKPYANLMITFVFTTIHRKSLKIEPYMANDKLPTNETMFGFIRRFIAFIPITLLNLDRFDYMDMHTKLYVHSHTLEIVWPEMECKQAWLTEFGKKALASSILYTIPLQSHCDVITVL